MFPYLLPYPPCSPLPPTHTITFTIFFILPLPYAIPITLFFLCRPLHSLNTIPLSSPPPSPCPNPLPILSSCHSLHILNILLHPLLPGLFILYMPSSHALHLSHTIPILSQYHAFPTPIPSPIPSPSHTLPSPSPPHAIHPSHALPFTLPILYLLPTLYLHLSLSLNAL